MNIWTSPSGKKIATADKHKMFKVDGTLRKSIEILTENESPVETYVYKGKEISNTEGRRLEICDRLSEIHKWFQSTDWIPNKLVLHEWQEDDIRAIEYRETRLAMRTEQDALIAELNNIL